MSALANNELDSYGLDRALAEEIRVLLVRRGLKQADLAEALGVTPGAVSHRLTGRTELTVRELGQLSAYFNISPADLLGALGSEVFRTTPR